MRVIINISIGVLTMFCFSLLVTISEMIKDYAEASTDAGSDFYVLYYFICTFFCIFSYVLGECVIDLIGGLKNEK